MKQFFLSFAGMLLFAATSFAQAQVEVFNNTGTCDFDVTVTSVDANCNTIDVYGPITINFGNSFVFNETDPTVVDFLINAQLTGTTTPPSFPFDIHLWAPNPCSYPVGVGTNVPGCGPTGFHHDPTIGGAFPNGRAYVD